MAQAALGAGLPIDEAYGTMIVDISAGVTDIAVLSFGKVIVSDWLTNPDGAGTLADVSTLAGVENVKGDETFDGTVWAANGRDIYYQGTSEETLPVELKITYTLDGEALTAAEIAGKSGRATIRFDYTLTDAARIEGAQARYIPFAVVTGALLEGLRQQQYDLIFASRPPQQLGLRAAVVGRQDLVLIVPKDHPLAMVYGVFNAVFVTGNMLGDSMYYGRGAGKLPTASAVVSDVIDCARHQGKVIMCFWDQQDIALTDIKQSSRRFFVRTVQDKESLALQEFESVSVITADVAGEFAFVTEKMTEKEFDEKAQKVGIISRIRID